MRESSLSKIIMTTALSVALIFGMTPGAAFAGNSGGSSSADGLSDSSTLNTQLSTSGSSKFSEDRVIVKLAAGGGSMSATASGNPQGRSFPPNLGVSFTDIRVLNPSLEISDTGGFSINSVHAQSQTFNSNTGSQNNVFVLTLEETGRDAVENALAILNANPAVEIAEPDYLYELAATPNDPMYNAQYALKKIRAEQAWDITTGGTSVVVGVVDTGIDGTHPDFAGNLWVNPNPGANGYENDIHGYNFTSGFGGIPIDTNGHGTHVAGIIGARGNNGIGASGINWNVSLAWLGIHTSGNSISVSAAIEAVNYANNHNIPILNNSYGGPEYSKLFEEAISGYNGLFVAAAGNEGSDNDIWPRYPASYDLPNIISVASTNEWDELSETSNYGDNTVHIAAPGNGILSTWLNGTYREISGTSMASAYVAGVAALIKAVNPDCAPEVIRAALRASTQPIAEDFWGMSYSFGIVDAYAALRFDISGLRTVTYDFLDDGISPVTVKVIPGSRLREPAEPSREGFVFDGWYTAAQGGVPYDFSDAVNGDMTLYARWFVPVSGMYSWEFPDLNFQREVLRLINEQDGGQRRRSGIVGAADKILLASFDFLDVSNKNIRDISGLAYFTGLTKLDCSQNRLTELDISKNTELTWLDCSDNELTELNVAGNARLTDLNSSYNRMASPGSVTGWQKIGLILNSGFIFYPQKTAFMDLQSEIAAYGDAAEDMIITVRADTPITSSLIIPGNPNGKTLTLTSDNDVRTLTRQRDIEMLVVNKGASVILNNIVIDGNKDAYSDNWGSLVYVKGGVLTMETGAVLTNNNGGGVNVYGGAFVMNGGEIRGNTVGGLGYGGGVNVSGGSFAMNGGEISGNTAGGIWGYGGGVYVWNGEFAMYGGEITYNTAVDGGGVYVADSGVFAMNGGKISDNAADTGGGGLHVAENGAAIMQDGEISVNTAFVGGGVFIFPRGDFTMQAGEIIDNTAFVGGGVYIDVFYTGDMEADSVFAMNGGKIAGNTAEWGYGGGLYASSGDFIMLGGEIIDNEADYGGGVYIEGDGEIILGGTAVISGDVNNNVYLPDEKYITLSTETPPALGMNIGIQTETADGVIVQSGANPGDAAYFFADESGRIVVYKSGQLVVDDKVFYGLETIGVTVLPKKMIYVAGEALNLKGMIVTATYDDGSKGAVKDYVTNPGNGAILNAIGKQTVTVVYEGKTADFTVTVNDIPGPSGEYIYEAGGVFYSSLDNLLLNIPDGSHAVVKLLEDVGSLLEIKGKTITFDLNGHDLIGGIEAASGSVITVTGDISGEVTVYGKGTIVNIEGDACGGVSAYDGGALNVSGDVYGDVMVSTGGTVTINGALNAKNDDYYARVDWQWLGKRDGFSSLIKPGYIEYSAYGGASAVWVKAPEFIYGDVNGDAYVNLLDIMTLARFLAVWEGAVINSNYAADVDDDGFVTLRDLLVLRRHFANWEGYETLPLRKQPETTQVMQTRAPLMYALRADASASVKKLNGNKNELTIAVTETFSDGSANTITGTFSINNNAAGSFEIGPYAVYVETKGNNQIRQCYIMNR